MKRVFILIFVFTLMLSTVSYAMDFFGEIIETIPVEWNVSSAPVGASGAEIADDSLRLYYDTTNVASKGKAELITNYFKASGDELILSMTTTATNNGSNVLKTLSVLDTKIFNIVELLRFSEGTLTVFGGQESVVIDSTKEHEIILAVNTKTSEGSIWLNNELVYAGALSNWKTNLDLNSLRFIFKNTALEAVSGLSVWNINAFKIGSIGERYSFSSKPQNGQRMILAEGMENIEINFGTEMSPVMQSKDNYKLTKNGNDIDFAVSKFGDKILVTPFGGLENLSEYSLTILASTDIFGKQVDSEKLINFTTSYEGYIAPIIETVGEPFDISLTEGEAKTFEFNVLQGDVDYIDVLVNNEVCAILNREPYKFDFLSDAMGTYTVSAIAYDALGGCDYTEDIKITVTENDLPVLEVSDITDGGTYDADALPIIKANATDLNGIVKIKLYIDGNLSNEVKSAIAEFEINGISSGEHVIEIIAYDVYGASNSEEISIFVTKIQYKNYYLNDFSSYGGNNALPSQMQGGSQRGYLDASVVTENFGKSLIIGIDKANNSFPFGNPAYVGIPANDTCASISFEFDLYISEKTDDYELSLKKSAADEIRFVKYTLNNVLYFNSSGKLAVTLEYNAKQWYHYKVDVDIAKKTFSMIVDNQILISNGILPSGMDVLNYFRIYGASSDTIKSFVAIDNVSVDILCATPSIIIPNGRLDYKVNSCSFMLSVDINPASLTKDKVIVTNDFGNVAIESVNVKSGVVTVAFAQPLESNLKYNITLDKTVQHLGGASFGVLVSAYFETSMSNFEITNGAHVQKIGGIYFEFNAENKSGIDISALVISEVWEGDAYKRTVAEKITIKSSGSIENHSVKSAYINRGEKIKTYIWSGLNNPKSLSKYVYSYE